MIIEIDNQKWQTFFENNEIYWWFDHFNRTLFSRGMIPRPIIAYDKEKKEYGFIAMFLVVGPRDSEKNEYLFLFNLKKIDKGYCGLLCALVHEMVHLYEHEYLAEQFRSKRDNHSKAFFKCMNKFGIMCNEIGQPYRIMPGKPYARILKQHRIDVPCLDKK